MPRIEPHPRKIADAEAIGGKRTIFTFTGVTGLALDCTTNGNRTWYVRYQVGHGDDRQPRSLRLGTHDKGDVDFLTYGQARDRAIEALVAAKAGRDIFAEKRPSKRRQDGETLDDLFQDYIIYAERNKRSWRQDVGAYNNRLSPTLGSKVAADITRKDIIYVLNKIAETAPMMANRAQVLLQPY